MRLISEGKNFSINIDCVKSRIPQEFWTLPFNKIVEKILNKKSKKYFVSIAFIRESKMKGLNKKYRNKDSSTDILSFNLDKDSGEILLSINNVRRKAKDFGMEPADYLGFLLIHGMLHLKGLDHGAIMDRQEKILCKFFSIKLLDVQNNSRNRYRHLPSTRRSNRERSR